MTTFKVGDRVRTNSFAADVDMELEGVGTVVKIKPSGSYRVIVEGVYRGALTPEVHYDARELELVSDEHGRRLTVKQGTNTSVFEGDFTFEVDDLNSYVQVKTGGYGRLTYRDTSRSLSVGDPVVVPLGWSNKEKFGEVIALGKGSYTGPVKNVIARLNREDLVA